ncbi:Transcription factor [Rhinocladiella similis]
MSKEDETEYVIKSRTSSTEPEENSNSAEPGSASKKSSKVAKPRLTEDQRNFNHKDAENKRRTAIRERFTELSRMVPGALGQEKSEQAMLTKTADYLREMIVEQRKLEALADSQGIQINDAGRLKDEDYAGPKWRQLNMEQYEASKQRKGGSNDEND